MVFLGVLITEPKRRKMSRLVITFGVLIFIMGLAIVSSGALYKTRIRKISSLVLFDEQLAIYGEFLVYSGTLIAISGCVLFKMSLDTRRGRRQYGSGWMVVVFFLYLTLLVTSLVILVIGSGLFRLSRDLLEPDACSGFFVRMKEYASKPEIRTWIDWVHGRFDCCASKAHREWFQIEWNIRRSNRNQVPASCCDPKKKKKRVCFHETAPMGVGMGGIYAQGCSDPVCSFLSNICLSTAALLWLAFIVQILGTIFIRYVRSSIDSATKRHNPTGPGVGYLFEECGFCPFLENYRVKTYAVPAPV